MDNEIIPTEYYLVVEDENSLSAYSLGLLGVLLHFAIPLLVGSAMWIVIIAIFYLVTDSWLKTALCCVFVAVAIMAFLTLCMLEAPEEKQNC